MQTRKLKRWVIITLVIFKIICLPVVIVSKLIELMAIFIEMIFDLVCKKFFTYMYRKWIYPVITLCMKMRFFLMTYAITLVFTALVCFIVNIRLPADFFYSAKISIIVVAMYFSFSFVLAICTFAFFKPERIVSKRGSRELVRRTLDNRGISENKRVISR